MSTNGEQLHRAYHTLSKREGARLTYSQSGRLSKHRDPQHAFYSVVNSVKNRTSNRYDNIFAYDRTSVIVDDEGYLNANVVCDTKGAWWVASQAPVPGAFYAFFRAIFTRAATSNPALLRRPVPSPERKVAILVQLTGWDENGNPKADRYIPDLVRGSYSAFNSKDSSHTMLIHPVSQKRLSETSTCLTELRLHCIDETEANSHLEKVDEAMTVYHYHFFGWPDHGVPCRSAVDDLRALVLEIGRRREELGGVGDCEVWVHCSAGVGRTGTFIALSTLLLPMSGPKDKQFTFAESPLGPLPLDLREDIVAKTVDQLREWRGMLVQGPDQLQLIYEMVGAQTSST